MCLETSPTINKMDEERFEFKYYTKHLTIIQIAQYILITSEFSLNQISILVQDQFSNGVRSIKFYSILKMSFIHKIYKLCIKNFI